MSIQIYMKNTLRNEILKLKNTKRVDKGILSKMLQQIGKEINLTRSENSKHHFCAFFLPIHNKSSIYLGDHIKAGSWIPPGGHIELGETSIETVIREMQEELQYQPQEKDIELYDLSIIYINKPNLPCKTHFDIWYLVHMQDMISFPFDKGEYYGAKWFDLEKGVQKVTDLTYNKIIKKLL